MGKTQICRLPREKGIELMKQRFGKDGCAKKPTEEMKKAGSKLKTDTKLTSAKKPPKGWKMPPPGIVPMKKEDRERIMKAIQDKRQVHKKLE